MAVEDVWKDIAFNKRDRWLKKGSTPWHKSGPMKAVPKSGAGPAYATNPTNIREIKHAYNYQGYQTMSKNVKANVSAFNQQYHLTANRIDAGRKGFKGYFPEQKMVSAQWAKYGKAAPKVRTAARAAKLFTPGGVAILAAEGIYKGTKRALGPGGTEFHTKKSKNKYGTKGY